MKLLWLAPTSMNLEPIISSYIGPVFWYDRHGAPPDAAMLDAVKEARPDAVAYIGTAGGAYCAGPETFTRIKEICPIVHLCGDASDAGWQPYLEHYNKQQCFTLTVNFDGNKNWPAGPADLTLLTPIAGTFYRHLAPMSARLLPAGFAGGYPTGYRAAVINRLRQDGLHVHPRDERYGSYTAYAAFMKSCRVAVNVAFSASENAKQVKGRVLEAGSAGCALVEMAGAATADWFTEGEDFITFTSPEDAAEKVNALLAWPERTALLARSLHARVIAEHAPAIFWKTVLERL